MFTGIIEQVGQIKRVVRHAENMTFWVEAPFVQELKIDQSVAHNGVCLTVDGLADGLYSVTAIRETLEKTNVGNWKEGTLVNLERCLQWNGRLDGHIVQGHVDTTGTVAQVITHDGSWEYHIAYTQTDYITVPKGSICINGVSLTVVNSEIGKLSVAIIPYTYEHTNFKTLNAGDRVNLEFDILGKYIVTLMERSGYIKP